MFFTWKSSLTFHHKKLRQFRHETSLERESQKGSAMKAEIIVRKDQFIYRIERGRARAEVGLSDRPQMRINFAGGALDVSLTVDEAYDLGAALIVSAEHQQRKKLHPTRRL